MFGFSLGVFTSPITQNLMIEQQRRHIYDAQRDASAARWQRIYGDRYAGTDHRGRAIVWRETTIPNVQRK